MQGKITSSLILAVLVAFGVCGCHRAESESAKLSLLRETAEYRVFRVEYPSAVPKGFPGGDRGLAFYYESLQPVSAKSPAVVCMHILGGDGSITRATAACFASHGLPALMPIMPLFLDRAPAGGVRKLLSSPEGPRCVAESMAAIPADIRAATDFLASRPGVDPTRLCITGTSLGGILAVSAAANDERFHKASFVLAGGDLKGILSSSRSEVRPIAEAISRASPAEREAIEAAIARLEPLDCAAKLRSRAATGAVRMINAAEDEVIPFAATEGLRQSLELAEDGGAFRLLPKVGHYSAICHLPRLSEELAEWFGGRKLPAGPDEALRRVMYAELLKAVDGVPASGRKLSVGMRVAVRVGDDEYGGRLSLRRDADGRFALRLADGRGLLGVTDLSLGRDDTLWAVAKNGVAFVGDCSGGIDFSSAFGPQAPLLLAMVRGVLSSAIEGGLPPALGEFAEVHADADENGMPKRISVRAKAVLVTVDFDEWNSEAPVEAGDFAPVADVVRKVDGVRLERILNAAIGFAVNRQTPRWPSGDFKCGEGLLACRPGSTPILTMRGTPQEMGRQHGELCAEMIRRTHERALLVAADCLYRQGDWFFDRIDEIRRRSSGHLPTRYLEELDAMSVAAGLTVAEGREIAFLPELFHCSGIAARGKATVGGQVVHARVLDYLKDMGVEDFSLVQVFRPAGFNAWLSIGFAGLNGTVTAMNEKGLAMGEMGGRGGVGEWDGLPMTYLMRRIMEECDTVAEAKRLIASTPLTCDYYYVLSDRSGDMTMVIARSGEPVTFVGPGESHPFLKAAFDDICWVTAKSRQDALCDRLREHYGRLDASTMQAVITRPVAMDSNLHDAIFLPETLEVYFALARGRRLACDSPYEHLDFSELLRQNP